MAPDQFRPALDERLGQSCGFRMGGRRVWQIMHAMISNDVAVDQLEVEFRHSMPAQF